MGKTGPERAGQRPKGGRTHGNVSPYEAGSGRKGRAQLKTGRPRGGRQSGTGLGFPAGREPHMVPTRDRGHSPSTTLPRT